jgi:signal transduction histidine kinase
MSRAPFTNPAAPRNRRLMRGGIDLVEAADVLIALLTFLSTITYLSAKNEAGAGPRPAMALGVSILVCVPVAARTRHPAAAWLASLLATVVASAVIRPNLTGDHWLPQSLFIYGLCLYSVAVRCRGDLVIGVAVVTVLGIAVANPATAGIALLAAFPLLGGTIVKVRRGARAKLTEQEHRHQGERALLEERQRIARELHDVVAHHMSVIAIHAEAAPFKVAEPPGELVESFTIIRASALKGLEELRRILGVLRNDGAPDTTPQPGLDRLDELLDGARGAGLTVRVHISGEPREVPQGVDLSAYRILQEAVSNALRHAPGAEVDVQLNYRPRGLLIEVRNGPWANGKADDGPRDPAPGGHGIVGMRERATMLGGELDAGPTGDGGFAVTAVLPYLHEAAA